MPGMLTAAQLTALQGFAATTLDLTANTTRKSGTGLDGRGHPNPTWPALLTAVACGMSEPTVTDFLTSEPVAKFSFPTGSDVKKDDRITMVSSGLVFRVQTRTDRDSYSLLVQCIAVQVAGTVN